MISGSDGSGDLAVHADRLAQVVIEIESLEDGREAGTIDIAAGAADGAQVPVGPDQLALRQGVAGGALHFHAFVDVEIDVLVVGPGGDGAGALRVPDHKVGVGSDLDRTLARVEI